MLRKITIQVSYGIFILILGCTELFAGMPGFDCNKARTNIEKAICDDQQLTLDDNLMAFRYRQLFKFIDGKEKSEFKKSQRKWLKHRNRQCGKLKNQDAVKKCLKELYPARVKTLHEIWDGLEPPEELKPKYPEVWGARLSLPKEAHNGEASVYIYTNKFKEIYIYYLYTVSSRSPIAKSEDLYVWRLYDLFSKELVAEFMSGFMAGGKSFKPKNGKLVKGDISSGPYSKILGLQEMEALKYKFMLEPEYHLPNGVKIEGKGGGGRYLTPVDTGLKFSKDGKDYKEIMIVEISDNYKDHPCSEIYSTCGGRSNQKIRTKSLILDCYFLFDGSYIVTGYERPFVFRLKSDLTSPFFSNQKNLFLLERAKALEVYGGFIDEAFEIEPSEHPNIIEKVLGDGKVENRILSAWEYADHKFTQYLLEMNNN